MPFSTVSTQPHFVPIKVKRYQTSGHLSLPKEKPKIYQLQETKMANNLLSFVNNASSNIQDAFGKPLKKKRVVNVRKFVQGNVKRLDHGSKPRVEPSTKSKLARKTPRPTLPHGSPRSWPDVSSCSTSTNMVPSFPDMTGVSTYGYPSTTMSATTTSNLRSYSEPDLCLPSLLPQPSEPIDPELESILSSFASSSVPLSRCSSLGSVCNSSLGSVCNSSLSCTPSSAGASELQEIPYSDISADDLDSVCSPIESARVSYNSSPTSFYTITTNNNSLLPTWTSPLNCGMNADWLPVTNSNCMHQISSEACDWMSSSDSLPMTVPVYDQGPPMTPTVSQLLEQYNPY